jgi:F-type H+-transporting ATPase subunit delta
MGAEKITIARPYAEAVFKIAEETDSLDTWSNDLLLISRVAGNTEIANLIGNPRLGKVSLQGLILDILGDSVSPAANKLVLLLIENNRLFLADEIVQQFELFKMERQNSINITIVSAYAVSKEEETKLSKVLRQKLGRDIAITTEKDTSLIGGIKIRAGDLVIDGSIRNKLARLATEFGI